MKYRIKPFPKKRELRFKKEKEIKKNESHFNFRRQQYTLSYRLRGLAFGLIIAGIWYYFFLEHWSSYILIIPPIFGYFLGYLTGNFLYTKK